MMNALKPVNMEYLDNQQRKGTKNNENCQHLHVKKLQLINMPQKAS